MAESRCPAPSSLRTHLRVSVVLLLAGLASACRGSAPEAGPPVNPMVPLAADAQLYYDDRGGIPDSIRVVVRNDGAWEDVWSRATSRLAEPPDRPRVDFAEHMVLVAGAGRMSPGDRIRVDSAGVRTERTTENEEDVFEVIVRTVEGCSQIRADVFPVSIVRLPRFEGRVSFVERSEQDDCEPFPDALP